MRCQVASPPLAVPHRPEERPRRGHTGARIPARIERWNNSQPLAKAPDPAVAGPRSFVVLYRSHAGYLRSKRPINPLHLGETSWHRDDVVVEEGQKIRSRPPNREIALPRQTLPPTANSETENASLPGGKSCIVRKKPLHSFVGARIHDHERFRNELLPRQ